MDAEERCLAKHTTEPRIPRRPQRRERRHATDKEGVLTRLRASSHACFMSVALALFTLTSSRSSVATGTRSASTPADGVGGASSLEGSGGGVSPLWAAGAGEAAALRVRGAMLFRLCGFS